MIIIRTKYVIDQQDIEISKNRTVTQNANILGSLAPLTRTNKLLTRIIMFPTQKLNIFASLASLARRSYH